MRWFYKMADIEYDSLFPLAGPVVDGRRVGTNIPNQDSIPASLTEYTVAKGIREVPMASFENQGSPYFYSPEEQTRTEQLAQAIKNSGKIDPLIVVYDLKGPYILEGGHRFDALKLLGAKSFPALVVFDEEANQPSEVVAWLNKACRWAATAPQTAPTDPSGVTPEQWDAMAAAMRSMGYDWPDGEYAKGAMGRLTSKPQWNPSDWPDHSRALAEAKGQVSAPKPKYHKYPFDAFQKAKREFGTTEVIDLAGWILPDGSLIDLSRGTDRRAFDHRNIGRAVGGPGGTMGMQQFMAAGAIRLAPEGGGLDISKPPTVQQMSRIAEVVRRFQGQIVLDLENGLGELDEGNELYRRSRNSWRQDYPLGTNPAQVLNDIRKFYGGKTAAWAMHNCRFAQKAPLTSVPRESRAPSGAADESRQTL